MEEKIERILRSAGIESAPVDPSSMEALRQLVTKMDKESNKETIGAATGTEIAAGIGTSASRPVLQFQGTANVSNARTAWAMESAAASDLADGVISPPKSLSVPKQGTFRNVPDSSGSGISSTGTGAGTSGNTATNTNTNTNTSLDPQTQSHNQVLELLHMHTILMMETQRKLDAMAAKVDALERQVRESNLLLPSYATSGRPAPGGTSGRDDAFSTSTRTRFLRQPLHADPFESNETINNNNNRYDNAPRINAPPALGQRAVLNQREGLEPNVQGHANAPIEQVGLFQSTIETISSFYVVRICRLFWTRSRGFVRPIDGALMFKLVFMLLVMSARISRSNGSITSKSATRLTISILMMLTGFLYHTKYLQFIYQFVWKDNIPMRVWAGEDVEADNDGTVPRNGGNAHVPRFRNPEMVPLPGQHNNDPVHAQAPNVNANANGNRVENLRQNFIGGAIHPPNQDQNPMVGFLQDALYLLGSFFLSVFPMWQPLRPPANQHQPHNPPETEPLVAANNNNNNNNNPEPEIQGRDQDSFHAIPIVAPPTDAMTPADDDDESTAASLE